MVIAITASKAGTIWALLTPSVTSIIGRAFLFRWLLLMVMVSFFFFFFFFFFFVWCCRRRCDGVVVR